MENANVFSKEDAFMIYSALLFKARYYEGNLKRAVNPFVRDELREEIARLHTMSQRVLETMGKE